MKFTVFLSKEPIKINWNSDMIMLDDLSCSELESLMKIMRSQGYRAVAGVTTKE